MGGATSGIGNLSDARSRHIVHCMHAECGGTAQGHAWLAGSRRRQDRGDVNAARNGTPCRSVARGPTPDSTVPSANGRVLDPPRAGEACEEWGQICCRLQATARGARHSISRSLINRASPRWAARGAVRRGRCLAPGVACGSEAQAQAHSQAQADAMGGRAGDGGAICARARHGALVCPAHASPGFSFRLGLALARALLALLGSSASSARPGQHERDHEAVWLT